MDAIRKLEEARIARQDDDPNHGHVAGLSPTCLLASGATAPISVAQSIAALLEAKSEGGHP